MKKVKKEQVSENAANTKVKSKKDSLEKVAETPVLEIATPSPEDHEILQLLGKKTTGKPKTHDIDYIPELERGDFDTVEE